MHFPTPLLLAEAELAGGGALSRDIFGNIPVWSQGLFYGLALLSLWLFGLGGYRRVRLWHMGRKETTQFALSATLRQLCHDVLLQRRVLGRGWISVAHLLLFGGFMVLLLGTTLIAIEHGLAVILGRASGDAVFHKGVYFAIYEAVMDTAGIALLVGTVLFGFRRLRRPSSVGHSPADWLVLGLLICIGMTGYLVEGLRILREATAWPGFSFVGLACGWTWQLIGVDAARATPVHFYLWWMHAVLALALIAVFPYTRLLHALVGTLTLASSRDQLGSMHSISIEEIEETGIVGVGKMEDFTRRQLRMLDACVSCGRCNEACPAHIAGKPLAPKAVIENTRAALESISRRTLHPTSAAARGSDAGPELHGDTVTAESLWACTTCSACVDVCPLGIDPLRMITDMRRFLVGEGQLRGSPATALQQTQRQGNPWGLAPQDRFQWSAGLNVPTVEDRTDFEWLYWVGCAAAYDPRIQSVARSMVTLLNAAGVHFAVLGVHERCTGESARRIGDEFLFQELAQQNIATLNRHRVQKIVTHCPHCLNTFARDYPQFGGHYEVLHHTELLSRLLDEQRLPLGGKATASSAGTMTYHDPCYLARVHGVTEAPRNVIESARASSGEKSPLVEMPRTGSQTLCCGAGGGRMWFDENPAERVSRERVREALDTDADVVTVSCPFCLRMMSDGVTGAGSAAQVRDISEVLVDALNFEGTFPSG